MEQYLQTDKGKRAIHFAYSFGAALVILGAMFKLLYFPFGNEMLFIGMVTEVLVFLISAFDTPVRDYPWEQVFPVLASQNPEDRPDFSGEATSRPTPFRNNESGAAARTISPQVANESGLGFPLDLTGQTENYNRQMEQLNSKLSGLNALYELQLKSISGQIDTIEQINRGLQRLKSSYSDSLPDGTLIGRETERMASQLRELNDAYARMLQAMTVSRGGNSSSPQT
ncbi:MAG TPA: gliding motility protein GldL [Proteiniphilum sp.]|nr:gliding motility protein GldL [Proteiniphilum sp.]HPJ51049.1 gliding motility protein GldL [Proteiniphilum sp.]HPR20567.1 gliding motility protein GldL [Proteiniphilum sp.]